MSALKKKIGKMLSQPTNINFKTLDSVLKGIGCTVRNTGGSHHVYEHPDYFFPISIPKANPIKRRYIIQVINQFGLKEKHDEIN
jgi:predicted RNA binding protein YcfA (HicA-like mRNA interferase family)